MAIKKPCRLGNARERAVGHPTEVLWGRLQIGQSLETAFGPAHWGLNSARICCPRPG